MRIDPLDLLSHTIASLPLRLFFGCFFAIAGAFTPIFLGRGWDAFHSLGWQWLLFPLYLLYMAVNGGYWMIFALPLLAWLGWRIISFICNENSGSDLIAIYTLAFLITIRAADDRLFSAIILGIYLFCQTLYLDRRDRRELSK